MTTTQKTKRMPGPVYAAAGAGDLAYQKLRTLPSKMNELRGRVRPFIVEKETSVDMSRLRTVARRNATAVLNTAQAAGERAAVVYGDLVTRGERVVNTMRAESREEAEPPAELESPAAELAATAAKVDDAETGKSEGKATTAKSSAKRTKPAAK